MDVAGSGWFFGWAWQEKLRGSLHSEASRCEATYVHGSAIEAVAASRAALLHREGHLHMTF